MGKKRREDSFLGMHFDFHAGKNQNNIGENCAPDVIDKLLTEVKPDYVQCDTKGHNGATSYPTKVGYPAPNIKADILRMWRDVTAKHDVALYAHHSGVWDNFALEHNPDWAIVDAEGNVSDRMTSVFGPYKEKLLVPQLLEMALDYGLDGVWIDGDCWATAVDYSEYAKEAYYQKYQEDPPKPDDEKYPEYIKFCRQGFRDYVNYYVTETHKKAPEFQIASNWMYTSFAPEMPAIGVDFISGDYSPNDSLNTARFEGRCCQSQGKPWDLMAWGFSHGNPVSCVKEYEQLCQEGAAIIMLGGGFQFYNRQMVGTVQEWAIPRWAKLAEFCREREEFCFKATPVPQVGIVYSEKAFYKGKTDLFTCYSSAYVKDMRGLLYAVLDNQLSAEILMTHHLLAKKSFNDYGVLILPNLNTIESDLKEEILEYVNRGGNLIIAGHTAAQTMLPYLDIDINGGSEEPKNIYINHNDRFAPLSTPYCTVSLSEGTIPFGEIYFRDDYEGESQIAASITKYGAGKIAGVYFDLGDYQNHKSTVVRDFLGALVNEMFEPMVKITGTKQIEVSLMNKNDKLCVNLLNLTGNHSDSKYINFDEVIKLHDIGVTIMYPTEPKSVYIEPEHTAVDYTYENGKIEFKIDCLHIHSVVVIE
ncbi:MAG: hypothetical protein FWF15_05750 [Oscillospiraceae bacterium]|nr:hypothetical protein [Oscillospiraceae bacterium]